MTDSNLNPRPKWLLIVGIISLLWNLMGVFAYAGQVMMMGSEEMLGLLPEEQQALYTAMPSWVNIAFAIAVFGGLIGTILFLMKKKLSVTFFALSLLGVFAQQAYVFFMSDTIKVMGMSSIIMPIIIIVFAIIMLLLSKNATAKGWFN